MKIIIGIYKITSPSHRVYIGQSVNILERLKKYRTLHCKDQILLYNSFKKYGFKKHRFEIIHVCDKTLLNSLETYYINLFQCFDSKYGLNLKGGGHGGGAMSEESKAKLKRSLKALPRRKHTEETKLKIGLANRGYKKFLGKRHSEESKKKTSASHMGRKFSDEHKEKLRQSKIGTKASEETRAKMSAAQKRRQQKRIEIQSLTEAA